jgi:hypothetical protein
MQVGAPRSVTLPERGQPLSHRLDLGLHFPFEVVAEREVMPPGPTILRYPLPSRSRPPTT